MIFYLWKKWTQTDTKVTFHPIHHPQENLFWSQMRGMAKIRIFYSSAIALILPRLKDITHFVFMIVYKEPKILTLWSLSTLFLVCPSVCWYFYVLVLLPICLSVPLTVLHSFFLSVCLSVGMSVLLTVRPSFCLSFCLSVLLTVRFSFCLSVIQTVRPSFCLSFCLFFCLSFCLSLRQT